MIRRTMSIRASWCAVVILGLLAPSTYALADTIDEGVIDHWYSNDLGAIAIHIKGGFPKAVAAVPPECRSYQGYWAGSTTAHSTMKATLLMAITTGKSVGVTTRGCDRGGDWLKIVDVYVK